MSDMTPAKVWNIVSRRCHVLRFALGPSCGNDLVIWKSFCAVRGRWFRSCADHGQQCSANIPWGTLLGGAADQVSRMLVSSPVYTAKS